MVPQIIWHTISTVVEWPTLTTMCQLASVGALHYVFCVQVELPGALTTSSSPQSHLASPLVASAATSVGENDTVAPDACVCDDTTDDEAMYTFSRHAIRSTYMDKSIEAKKKVSDPSNSHKRE